MAFSIGGGSSQNLGVGLGSSSSSSTTETAFNKNQQAVLDTLLATLASGGTAQQKYEQATRKKVTEETLRNKQSYSKEAAMEDSELVMQQNMRRALQQVLPELVRSAEGAGTSQNSLRALLTQDAAVQAAQSSAALGLDAAARYGGIDANLTAVLERLTEGNDPTAQLLIQALQVAKGSTTNRKSSQPVGFAPSTMVQPSVSSGRSAMSPLPSSPSFMMSYTEGSAADRYGKGGLDSNIDSGGALTSVLSSMGAYDNLRF
jgi:hypothetical protein